MLLCPLSTICFSCTLLLSLLDLLAPHNLPPLYHHMGEQNIGSRHIDEQDQLQGPSIFLSNLPRGFNSLIDQPTLTTDPQRIQHKESIVSQPTYNSWLEARECECEVWIPYNFGDAPCNQHAGIPGWFCEVGEVVDNAPNEEETWSYLHGSCANRSPNDACRNNMLAAELQKGLCCKGRGRAYQ